MAEKVPLDAVRVGFDLNQFDRPDDLVATSSWAAAVLIRPLASATTAMWAVNGFISLSPRLL
jgi:hypothetical protein